MQIVLVTLVSADTAIRSVNSLSAITRSVHRLTENKLIFKCTEECKKSFNYLKQTLTSTQILAYPEINKSFIMGTDVNIEVLALRYLKSFQM